MRVVGVAPRGFFGFQPGTWTDLYAPIAARASFEPIDSSRISNDAFWWVSLIGRLADQVPADLVRQRVENVLQGFVAELAPGTAPESLPGVSISSAARGFDGALQENEIKALWILQLLVGVLLLIVCANVANLLLSRSVSVQRESALRRSLGASRTRLFQKSLIESATLALLGGVLGLIVGTLLARTIHDMFQTGRDAGMRFDLGIDWRLIGWVIGLSLVTTLLFGLLPAVRAMRAGVSDVLRTRSRSVLGGGLRLPRVLVAVQIALCFAALTSAGLLSRSLDNFAALDLGFDAEGLSYATVNPSSAGYSADRVAGYVENVRNAVQALPGVEGVSFMRRRVLDGAVSISPAALAETQVENVPFDLTDAVHVVGIGEDALQTLGIALLRGRSLNARDDGNAVVDQRFVQHFFGNEPALGRRIRIGAEQEYTIVGIARHVPWGRLRQEDFPAVYTAAAASASSGFGGRLHFAIRSSLNPAVLAGSMRSAIASVDRAVPLIEFRTQQTLIDRLLRVERLLAFVSGSFGLWALLLSAIGLAGLLTYAAARRTGEIGVRMALGASPASVVQMMLRDSSAMVVAGILIGLPCAWAIGKLLESLLFELSPADLRTFVPPLIALSFVAFAATWLPARRASRIDPTTALREQ